jgi:hypothetical protein
MPAWEKYIAFLFKIILFIAYSFCTFAESFLQFKRDYSRKNKITVFSKLKACRRDLLKSFREVNHVTSLRRCVTAWVAHWVT